MRSWDVARIAEAAGARVVRAAAVPDGPERAVIDSRAAGAGDLPASRERVADDVAREVVVRGAVGRDAALAAPDAPGPEPDGGDADPGAAERTLLHRRTPQ